LGRQWRFEMSAHEEANGSSGAAQPEAQADAPKLRRARFSASEIDAGLLRLRDEVYAFAPTAAGGAALGILVWVVQNFEQRAYFATNALPEDVRRRAALYPLGACLLALVIHGIAHFCLRSATSRAALALSIQPWALALVSTPLLAFHTVPSVESQVPVFLLFTSVVTAAIIGWAAYLFWARRSSAAEARALAAPGRPYLAAAVLGVLCLGYALYLSAASIAIHRNLGSHLDLAVYDNVLWTTADRPFLACDICAGGTHASSHFDPLLVMMAPIYRLYSHPETLLVLQSLWLASGAAFVFLLARRTLGTAWGSLAIACCYLLYPPLHGANLFGFHSLVLCVPLILAAIYFLDSERYRAYWISLGLLLLVREDMPLVVAGVALFAWASEKRVVAVASLLAAGLYLLTVKLWMMADAGLIMAGSKSTVSFAHYFKHLIPDPDAGATGLIVSLISNPVYAVKVALHPEKVEFALLLLAPLLFLPLIGGRKLWVGAWGVAFAALASRKAVYSPHFQYSCLIFPALFAALPDAILRLSEGGQRETWAVVAVRRAAIVACLVASLLVSAKFGAFVKNESLRGGWERPVWSLNLSGSQRYRDVLELARLIPDGASVASSRGLLPYVSNRGNVVKSFREAEYLLLDLKNIDAKRAKALKQAKQEWKYEVVETRANLELRRRAGKNE